MPPAREKPIAAAHRTTVAGLRWTVGGPVALLLLLLLLRVGLAGVTEVYAWALSRAVRTAAAPAVHATDEMGVVTARG